MALRPPHHAWIAFATLVVLAAMVAVMVTWAPIFRESAPATTSVSPAVAAPRRPIDLRDVAALGKDAEKVDGATRPRPEPSLSISSFAFTGSDPGRLDLGDPTVRVRVDSRVMTIDEARGGGFPLAGYELGGAVMTSNVVQRLAPGVDAEQITMVEPTGESWLALTWVWALGGHDVGLYEQITLLAAGPDDRERRVQPTGGPVMDALVSSEEGVNAVMHEAAQRLLRRSP